MFFEVTNVVFVRFLPAAGGDSIFSLVGRTRCNQFVVGLLSDVFAVVSLGSLWEARNHVFCMEMVKGEQSEAKG